MKRILCYVTMLTVMGASATPLLARNQSGNCDGKSPTDTDNSNAPVVADKGPLQDKMSESGELFGDLHIIQRYEGTETKNVPAVDESGNPILVLSDWVDENGDYHQVYRQGWTMADAIGGEPMLTEEYANYTIVDEETGEYVINPMTGGIYYPAPYPSQCVQPLADSERWGDISSKSGLDNNRIPITMSYDPTWERTECDVNPGLFIAAGESWNGITYYKDIYWSDLVQEVEFGRLNLGRAPEAVLDQSFDEAISAINKADEIWLDASGRMVLRTKIYDEFLTDAYGEPLYLETIEKAIDSPKENLALYLKLIKDGHLITPADDRQAIVHSLNGGIPSWKAIELEDGPSTALRPTIDIDKMIEFGLGYLVDAKNIDTYYTYTDEEGKLVVTDTSCEECEQWHGIKSRSEQDFCAAKDFSFTASFLAAAADKTGNMTVDKIVYLNSIMGVNKVVGYSDYNGDGTPAEGAIDYKKNPIYYDFGKHMHTYNRRITYQNRGLVETPAGYGLPATYNGMTRVLVESTTPGIWMEKDVDINLNVFDDIDFSGNNIRGFNQMSHDDLRVIEYIHTYQIPGLR